MVIKENKIISVTQIYRCKSKCITSNNLSRYLSLGNYNVCDSNVVSILTRRQGDPHFSARQRCRVLEGVLDGAPINPLVLHRRWRGTHRRPGALACPRRNGAAEGWSNSSEPMEDSSSLEPYIMTRGGMLPASQSS